MYNKSNYLLFINVIYSIFIYEYINLFIFIFFGVPSSWFYNFCIPTKQLIYLIMFNFYYKRHFSTKKKKKVDLSV